MDVPLFQMKKETPKFNPVSLRPLYEWEFFFLVILSRMNGLLPVIFLAIQDSRPDPVVLHG
jgi:hypothetical protein